MMLFLKEIIEKISSLVYLLFKYISNFWNHSDQLVFHYKHIFFVAVLPHPTSIFIEYYSMFEMYYIH